MRTTNPRPNPRHTSKLESLPIDQRRQLESWLREGITYDEIVQRMRAQFGVKTASSSLSGFYSRHIGQTSLGESAVRDLRIGEDTIEFEIVSRVRIHRADLAAVVNGK